MNTKRKNRYREELPLTMKEILQRDNIPASETVPMEIAEKLASNKIVLSSDDRGFDPRKQFTKIKGSKGAWELSTKGHVTDGLRVKKMERVKPSSLKRTRGARITPAYQPPWQPYVYHPKTMVANFEPQMLKRKSGARVRPHGVFNRDDREVFLPVGYPWHCIGHIYKNFGNGWQPSGTGTLVGPRTVLCSAHMIPWGQPSVGIVFNAGYFSWSTFLMNLEGSAGSSFVTDAQGYNVPGRVGFDMAVMRLADPLGGWLGTFGSRTYNDDWEDDPIWTLVGYPAEIDNGQMPTRQFGISVEDDDADSDALELEHYGDSSPGNSGGPLFGQWPNGPYIIGVQSGDEIDDFGPLGTSIISVAAGGNAMVNLVRWANETWV